MALVIAGSVSVWGSSAQAQSLPPNPAPTCTVPAQTFAGWFQTGKPSPNGVVNPADSLAFSGSSNCAFYQWSEQMFLWMTSPAPPSYGGGGGRIFDSPTFFDVSPPSSNGQRVFLPHTPGFIHPLALRAAQVGPHGLPVVVSRAGQLLEVESAPATAVPQIRDASGKLTRVQHIRSDNGRRLLLDAAGKEIKFTAVPVPRPAPLPPTARATGLPATAVIRKFVVDKAPIFVDSEGNVIQTEEGQAGGGDVLMAQSSSKLIYYVTMANDVFAYYRTLIGGTTVPATAVFPTTPQQLNTIVQYAASRGRVLVDANALAIEAKTSWIEADGLPNLAGYITMTATIPTYDTTSSKTWTQNGQKTVQLALLGVHVVGSTAGHAEMIWATFEHMNNTPNAAYSYVNTANQTIPVPQNTAGAWLFTESGTTSMFNQAHMAFANPSPCAANSICAISPFSISPSNTLRLKPFGAALNTQPNPLDATAAASNSEIIAINNSVRGQLLGGDIRGNYTMLGATWTIGGAAPSGSFSQAPKSGWPSPNEVGTSLLANSTMESYQQGATNDNSGTNCFGCHSLGSASQTTATTALSHVFSPTQPLP